MDPKVLVAEGEELTELYEDSNGHLPQSLRDMGINNIKDLGRFNLPGGQSVSSHAPCDFDDGAFFFFFSDCLLVFLCLFQIVPHVGERHRDMILKVCSYLKTIIWDKYKNDDAATRSIFFFSIGGNFEVSFKAATDIALKVRPWSCTFAHLQRTCSLNLCVLHLFALMTTCALNVCALHLFGSCSGGLITSAWTPRCSWRRARS